MPMSLRLGAILFLAVFMAFGQNQPPVISGSGNQGYCPGNPIAIVEQVSITDPDDTTTNAIYIQISGGYVNGQDLLNLTGTHPNITASWDVTQGKLTLQGPTTYTEFEAAIRDTEFVSTAPASSGDRQFSITVGEANYLPTTDHYYRFISDPGITWSDARVAAAASTYFGLQGTWSH